MVYSRIFRFLSRARSGQFFLFYPPKGKYPTRKRPFFEVKTAWLWLFLIICGITSCKTCDCPAYSGAGKMETKPAIGIRPGSTAMQTTHTRPESPNPEQVKS